ncbi:MarR family winged helix-turn-helix transcriptional regulator [Actinocrispum wychmicini]|uniref:DNA-binding MarR family transcriptional regulator n=1 Tax=Actinocrispum wychmicini TaxID=1213861 RepID=A0A4V2S8T0_9PSEU|nr:MarR family winged helix-turn-helix transcriptional regulator [Actinocrispum wychmicini]TCO65030.1 DNA-binding MarR family transcriptional regulator [Actinocrispum wychmicini]
MNDDELLDAVGPAFSRLRRTQLLHAEPSITRKDLTRTLVLNIVAEGEPDQEMTIGGVAERLAVDPSVGSRMVNDCITAGLLLRVASQSDGRRTVLRLTASGRALTARFRKLQRRAFENITRDWSATERREFARLLLKYVDSVATV